MIQTINYKKKNYPSKLRIFVFDLIFIMITADCNFDNNLSNCPNHHVRSHSTYNNY